MNEEKQQEVFNEWIRQHKNLLFKVARSFEHNEGDQDDLFQEMSIQVWRSVGKFRQQSAVSTWIYRIALNTAINWSRKEKKHQSGRQGLESSILHQSNEHIDDRLAWLYDEITKLDQIDKSLTLLILDGYSYKEMAEILGVSDSNLGVKVHRIKKHLIDRSKYYNHGI